MGRVMKKCPTARMRFDSQKNLYIEANGINLSDEHLLPPTRDPKTAWEMADVSLKVTQNLNRTHPLRADMYDANDKKSRIKKRRTGNIGEYTHEEYFDI